MVLISACSITESKEEGRGEERIEKEVGENKRTSKEVLHGVTGCG